MTAWPRAARGLAAQLPRGGLRLGAQEATGGRRPSEAGGALSGLGSEKIWPQPGERGGDLGRARSPGDG